MAAAGAVPAEGDAVRGLCVAILCAATGALAGCSDSSEQEKGAGPAPPTLGLVAEPVSEHAVSFTIRTTLPPPVEVMASVDLAGQKDDDVYMGHSERVTLQGPVTRVVIDTSKARDDLPSGEYVAEVIFYPNWGAEGNEAAAHAPELRASQPIKLIASGGTRAAAEIRNQRQAWVMDNVIMGTAWDEKAFVARLGQYEKSPSDLSHLHDAYYFPGANMTLIVNRLKGEVTIWRQGKQTR